ncbi:sensor histidine kinase [Flavobacterium sp. TSSA_36]|uniref:sensor histidine kinase n=1 Tax=Flavobacterium sp. TSSA_36 TaxID=3447669 RepID=UPI003F2AEEFC
MNPLLSRQIKKKLKPEQLEEIQDFLNLVNASYDDFDQQLIMLQRAMKISSDELFFANQKLRAEAESLKEINKKLEEIFESMNVEVSKINKDTAFNTAEYLKQQALEIVSINEQREILLQNLEKQNKELSDYAHVVSHDLKAPLRNIDTLIGWFMSDYERVIAKDGMESLKKVIFNVEKMDLLIKGILDYSTIDKIKSEDRLVDFNHLCDEVVKTIVIPKNITITIEDDLPIVYGNFVRFKQVLLNLIENAVKNSDKDYGSIRVGCIDKSDHFEFFVKDNGKGIDPKYFERIFNVFTKLDNDTQAPGIGLSIVKKIISLYHGKVWLESEEKEGTTFYFTLPKNNGKS